VSPLTGFRQLSRSTIPGCARCHCSLAHQLQSCQVPLLARPAVQPRKTIDFKSSRRPGQRPQAQLRPSRLLGNDRLLRSGSHDLVVGMHPSRRLHERAPRRRNFPARQYHHQIRPSFVHRRSPFHQSQYSNESITRYPSARSTTLNPAPCRSRLSAPALLRALQHEAPHPFDKPDRLARATETKTTAHYDCLSMRSVHRRTAGQPQDALLAPLERATAKLKRYASPRDSQAGSTQADKEPTPPPRPLPGQLPLLTSA
jgi:hypothetical protein